MHDVGCTDDAGDPPRRIDHHQMAAMVFPQESTSLIEIQVRGRRDQKAETGIRHRERAVDSLLSHPFQRIALGKNTDGDTVSQDHDGIYVVFLQQA
jgi:hypothetical protein